MLRAVRTAGIQRFYNTLASLAPPAGATRQRTRVGRGPGSGRGKTAGRGTKGQKARGSVRPHFEGGQTPIAKLFPKVGFRSKLPRLVPVNLGTIQRLIDEKRLDAGRPISMRDLYLSGCVGATCRNGVKLLAGGSAALRQPVSISASKASDEAIAAIEAAGGSYQAQFYPEFNMKVLAHPETFYAKHARIPLRARPVRRRDIEYYRREDKRGCLHDAPGAPQVKPPFVRATRTSPLLARLQQLREHDASREGARLGFAA